VPYAVKCIACAAIIAVAAVTVTWKAHEDLAITAAQLSPRSVEAFNSSDASWQCIFRAIRAAVPKGAPVYVGTEHGTFFQRLAELTTPWAVPEPRLSAARWSLTISRAAGACSGLKLTATRT
jgi:hypothetical protein